MIYCDTSYLVRLYLDDPGCEEVRALCLEHEITAAAHARVELPAALHRALREGRLTPEAFAVALAQFEADCAGGAFHWYPLAPSLLGGMCALYARLPADTFLRATDALHLACAAANGFAEIYSNDRHLLAAAPRFGLRGRNVIPD